MINIRIIIFLLLATVCFFLLLRYQGRLENKTSPLGIVSLEFAGSPAQVKEIRAGWKAENKLQRARNNILLDFLFIPFYSMLFYTLCGSISVRSRGFVAKAGVMLAFGALVAGLLDFFENILMLFSLGGLVSQLTVILTSFFASSKFILLVLALLYVIPFGLVVIIQKLAYGKSSGR